MRRFFILFFVVLSGCSCSHQTTISEPFTKIPELQPWMIVSHQITGQPAYLSNGTVGVRMSASGTGLDKDGKTLPAFLANNYTYGNINEILDWTTLKISVDGKYLYPDNSQKYEQILDMREGILTTHWRQKIGSGEIDVTVETFVSKTIDKSICSQVVIKSSQEYDVKAQVNNPQISKKGYKFTRLFIDGGIDPPADPRVKKALPDGTSAAVTKKMSAFDPVRISFISFDNSNEPYNNNYLKFKDMHQEEWAQLWKHDIEVEGDIASQQRIHSWLFALYSSLNQSSISIPPMGLSSNLYNGHIFWDADIWIAPAVLPFHLELSNTVNSLRLAELPYAKNYAKFSKLKGARFPWEANPVYDAKTPFDLAPGKFKNEIHITGDVAFSLMQSLAWFWKKPSYNQLSLLRETADFWASRAALNPKTKKYEIKHVISPDEDDYVDNDLYTNALAKWNLLTAAKFIPNSNPAWTKIANNIYLPKDKNRYLTFDNDTKKEYKQAAALLTLYPLNMPMPLQEQKYMLDYYAPKTEINGPAMSQAIYAVIAARLGENQKAWDYFEASYKDFMKPPLLQFNETRKSFTDKTYFCTGAGGCLQAVIYGFGGFSAEDGSTIWKSSENQEGKSKPSGKIVIKQNKLLVNPHLPARWKRLTFKGIHWNGRLWEITITSKKVTILETIKIHSTLSGGSK